MIITYQLFDDLKIGFSVDADTAKLIDSIKVERSCFLSVNILRVCPNKPIHYEMLCYIHTYAHTRPHHIYIYRVTKKKNKKKQFMNFRQKYMSSVFLGGHPVYIYIYIPKTN